MNRLLAVLMLLWSAAGLCVTFAWALGMLQGWLPRVVLFAWLVFSAVAYWRIAQAVIGGRPSGQTRRRRCHQVR